MKKLVFVPAGINHAITEVVFGLVFERPFAPEEITAVLNNHEAFNARLPGVNKMPSFPIFIQGQQIGNPNGGVAFDRYNSAGELEQRLRIEGNSIHVNSLIYSRWEAVAPEALSLISECMSIAIQTKNEVKGVLLQYVDLFQWQGDIAQYKLSELFDAKGNYYPPSIFGRGPFWHLHQGWFRTEDLPAKGKMLERLTTDGVLNENGQPVVKIDCYLGLDIDVGASSSDLHQKRGTEPSIHDLFNYLHQQNKLIIKNCLTTDMNQRIGL